MNVRSAALALATTATAAALTIAVPAEAGTIDKGHFTEVIDSGPYDCDGLVTAADSGEIRFNFRAVLRGSSPFPYYVENTTAPSPPPTSTPAGPLPRSSPAPTATTPSPTTGTAPSPSWSIPRAAGGATTPTATWYSRIPAAPGSASASTTTAPPATPTTTRTSRTRSRSSATPPGATTPRAATSARIWCCLPAPSHLRSEQKPWASLPHPVSQSKASRGLAAPSSDTRRLP